MTEDTRDPISDAHRGPECHVIIVETNDPNMTTQQMADAVLDALHDAGNHDVIHVEPAGDVAKLTQERNDARRAYELKVQDLAKETLRVSAALRACDRSANPWVGQEGGGYATAQDDIRRAIERAAGASGEQA
jgi:hypothetical protein